jgi:hypothetical protein
MTVTGAVIWAVVLALVALSFVLPLRYRKKWEGRWRTVALLPLGLPAIAIVNITIGLMIDPRSHTLFPFEIIIGCLCSLVATLLVAFIKRVTS